MTTEEAIKTIEVAIGEVEWDYPMDYAVALEMAIEALDNQQKWISVKDRLPDDDDTVLVYKPLAKGTTIEIQVTQGWCINPSVMSHWMPLPEPPKEENT